MHEELACALACVRKLCDVVLGNSYLAAACGLVLASGKFSPGALVRG